MITIASYSCDRCGRLYKPNGTVKKRSTVGFVDVPSTNKVTITLVIPYSDQEGCYEQDTVVNLCPDCFKSFMSWAGEVKEQGMY